MCKKTKNVLPAYSSAKIITNLNSANAEKPVWCHVCEIFAFEL